MGAVPPINLCTFFIYFLLLLLLLLLLLSLSPLLLLLFVYSHPTSLVMASQRESSLDLGGGNQED